jgi:hypothetical protein
MIDKVSGQVLFSKSEVVMICQVLVKVVKSEKVDINICKYVIKTTISMVNQKSPELISIYLSFTLKLRDFVQDKKKSFYIGIIIWVILKAISLTYDNTLLTDYVHKSITNYLSIEIYKNALLSPEEFQKILKNDSSVFSKHPNETITFKADIFDIESVISQKINLKDLEDNEKEDEYLPQNSETEFSSISSHDIQERILEVHDFKPEAYNTDYASLLALLEEQDKKIYDQI